MLSKLFGKLIFGRSVQPEKAPLSIVNTESGIVTEVNLTQSLNVYPAIVVILELLLTVAKFKQPSKAKPFISVTELGIVILF